MECIGLIKQIAETVTTVVTAIVIIAALVKKLTGLKYFLRRFNIDMKCFFQGIEQSSGKRVRFFKGLKEQKTRNKRIIEAVAPDFEMEDVLVLDKKALLDIISKSGAFNTIHRRK